MTDPAQILLYGAVLISIALGLLVLSLVVSYLRLHKTYSRLKERKNMIESDAHKEAEKIMDEARKKSMESLKQARIQASKIINEAGVITQEAKQKMLSDFSTVTTGYAQSYQQLLAQAKDEAIKIIDNISKDIKSQAASEIGTMKSALTQEVAKAQETTRKAILQSIQTIEKEMEAYKKARIQKVDENVFEILRQVTQRVIGRALSPQDHEDLVIKSLEEAKKENVF